MNRFDQIIIGQGIAGSALAWQLRWLGQSVLIVDRDEAVTSSKIASGLISPISGKRSAVSWRFDELWPVAGDFYRRVEEETGQSLLHCRPMLKVDHHAELTRRGDLQDFVGKQSELPAPFVPGTRVTELQPAGRLDVPAFLRATRKAFGPDGHRIADIDPSRDLEIAADGIVIRRLGVEASRLVFCQGIAADGNVWFPHAIFEPTKGEILTLKIPGLAMKNVVSHDVWLAPIGDEDFLAGATYEREFRDTQPTSGGREEILEKVSVFAPAEIEVVAHHAALRPSMRGRLPQVGFSAEDRRIAFFNGLGSKGALRAPRVARQLARCLVERTDMDAEIQFRPPQKKNARPLRLTELAHKNVSEVLRPGEVAVDATSGNGYDTSFLAKAVGPTGRVFGFDIQAAAMERTQKRLDADNLENVRLLQVSHAELQPELQKAGVPSVSVVMFNLGYLPRGDKSQTTTSSSTLSALEQAVTLLRPGGLVSVLAYTGHPGGLEEAEAVQQYCEALPAQQFEFRHHAGEATANSPRLYVVRRVGHTHLQASEL